MKGKENFYQLFLFGCKILGAHTFSPIRGVTEEKSSSQISARVEKIATPLSTLYYDVSSVTSLLLCLPVAKMVNNNTVLFMPLTKYTGIYYLVLSLH